MGSDRPKLKSVDSLSTDDIVATGLSAADAQVFLEQLKEVVADTGRCPSGAWRLVSKELLHPKQPHVLHRLMYTSIYKDWDEQKLGPPPVWFPSQETAWKSNLGRLMEAKGKELLGSSYHGPIESFAAFQKFSAEHPEIYWPIALNEISVQFYVKPKCIFQAPDPSRPGGTWLPGAVLNAAECCLLPKPSHGKTDSTKAIVWRNEGKESLHCLTYGELRAAVNQVSNALDALGFKKGDAIAIDMPMNVSSSIIYLAIILAGYVVVGIADSFSSSEIAIRIKVSKAKAIFTQDVINRGGKAIPLYSRVIEAKSPLAIVIPADDNSLTVTLRNGDVSWSDFLGLAGPDKRAFEYQPMQAPIESYTNILFSSGTSGEPKAVPYSHIQALRLGAESWAHMDLKVGDVFVWPTNLGWMMGPFLLYASFLNGATVGLYNGSPLNRGFGEFLQDAGVTILGTVPTIVKTWRKTNCIDGFDWSRIRLFASTGEASNADDDLWLMARAFYKPIFETCGGTELASAFLQGSLLQPQALAAFSTPSMTTMFVILDEQGHAYPDDQPCIGEIALMPMLGASHTLLNADHNKIYYSGMPTHKGMILRRHGDVFERTVGGFYRSHGRCDDTMNLGGIKTSAVEIERVCNRASDHVVETAAVAVPPMGGGPDKLVIFAVLHDLRQTNITNERLKAVFTNALQKLLNPYFKVSLVVVTKELPRTATNKVLRRVLRANFMEAQNLRNKL